MGLFSGKKKTYRDFSYARMIEDDYLPNVIGQAITTFVLDDKNQKGLTELMLEYGWKSNAIKWDAAYRYADKPGKYTYGNPTATAINQTDVVTDQSLDDVLTSLTGQANLNYKYSKFGVNNFRHSMWQLLVSNYAYDATANTLNQLTASLGATCYLSEAITYLTTKAVDNGIPIMFEHWGFSPTSGVTPTRTQDLSRGYTPDGVSSTGANYTRIEYQCKATGVTRNVTKTTTKVVTLVRTPNGSGGYDDVTTESSSDTTSTTMDWGGFTLPSDVISQTETVVSTTPSTVTDPPDVQTSTDPTTGVITQVTTTVTRDTIATGLEIIVTAFFNMAFGQYDFTGDDSAIDTNTVLDDRDSDNYDPNAVLDPSGEDTAAEEDFFQVCYWWDATDGTHIGYFTYQYGSGSYPDLDGITSTPFADFGDAYPRMYFRLNGNKLNEPQYVDTDAYKTSMKFANKLDMDWSDVLDSVYEGIGSLSKVRDIVMLQMVPVNTTDRNEQEYLFKYFKTLYQLRRTYTDADIPTITATTGGGSGGSPTPVPTDYTTFAAHAGASMKTTDGTMNTYNDMDALGWKTNTGVIGIVGHCESGHATGTKPLKMVVTKTETIGGGGSGNGTTKTTEEITYGVQAVDYHYYKMQVSETEWEEVRVFELSHRVDVGGHSKGASGTDERVMVPLDHAFRKEFAPRERELLFARATHLLICTEYSIKSKWYTTGIFKAIIVVVAVVLAWWTGGASMTLIGALTAVATAIGTMIAFSLLSKYVFSKLGGAFAIIATIVAIAVALYTGYVATTGTEGLFSLTASQLMSAANVAFQAAQSAQQGVIADEMQKMARLQDQIEKGNRELEAAQHELNGSTNSIDNLAFMNRLNGYSLVGEAPQSYYSRSLNTNIGAMALYLPDIYYAQSLTPATGVSIFGKMQQDMSKPFELNDAIFNI